MIHDRRGAAAVEFAVIAPVMLTIFFGTSEVSQGVALDRKVVQTARTLSDLVAQSTAVNDADMTNIFNAAAAILTPYSSTPLHAKVSAIDINANGIATVKWSKASNSTERAVGSTVTLPPALVMPNSQLIWSEISYDYKPPVGYFITGTLTLTDQFFARPRQSATVDWKTS
jgi:Flp pilus assembly protein TadG